MNNSDASLTRLSRLLLEPLVSILLRSGLTYRRFCEIAKSVFVHVALHEYGTDSRTASVSHAALLTGLTRREVSRQRGLLLDPVRRPTGPAHGAARILDGWYTDTDFLGSDGQPRRLPEQGPGSFESLYYRYHGTNVPLSTTLKVLVDSGSVARLDDRRLEVRRRDFRPDAVDPQRIHHAGAVLQDLTQTLRHNLSRHSNEPTRFEERIWSGRVPAERVEAFRTFLEERGQRLLRDIETWLAARESESAAHSSVRLGAGLYEIGSDTTASRVLPRPGTREVSR